MRTSRAERPKPRHHQSTVVPSSGITVFYEANGSRWVKLVFSQSKSHLEFLFKATIRPSAVKTQVFPLIFLPRVICFDFGCSCGSWYPKEKSTTFSAQLLAPCHTVAARHVFQQSNTNAAKYTTWGHRTGPVVLIN